MTGPRKRTLALAGLLAAWLVGVTANSSEAARSGKRAEAKNHSTSKKKATATSKIENAERLARMRTHSTMPEREEAIRRILAERSGAPSAPLVDKQGFPVAETPRVTAKAGNTRPSPSQSRPAADDSAIREALARRQVWVDPRQSVVEPVPVQEPPVNAAAPSRSTTDQVGQEPVLMARNTPAGDNEDIIREALGRRGTPYVWGGASRGGFDCSGFVCYVFAKQRGMKLPHSASAQARIGTAVAKDDLEPGDVVFFATYRPTISHVGIYVGDGKFVHAANRRKGCRVDTLNSGYYAKRYRGARRYTPKRFTPDEFKPYTANSSELPPTGDE